MKLKWAQLLTAAALILSIGGHWVVLQTAAWVGMVIQYSQEATLQEAFQKTFDGKHPCRLCKIVQRGQAHERHQEGVKSESKLEGSLSTNDLTVIAPARQAIVTAIGPAPDPLSMPPPTPPPRLA